MNPLEMKLAILAEAEKTGIRKKILGNVADGLMTNDDVLEMGNAFEDLKRHKGWFYLEAYILQNANLVSYVMSGQQDPLSLGKIQGLMGLMQHVEQIIAAKNDLEDKAREN